MMDPATGERGRRQDDGRDEDPSASGNGQDRGKKRDRKQNRFNDRPNSQSLEERERCKQRDQRD